MAIEPLPARDSSCAVVVTYHPDDGFPERVARISAQVSRVFVVDNASPPSAREMLAEVVRRDPRVELVLADSNEGIGAALNRGFARAIAEGFAWVVTLDQDSIVAPDLVAELAAIRAEHPRRELVKLLAPNYRAATGEPGLAFPEGAGRWEEVPVAITSGAMVSVAGYQAVGPFREDFFIDYVDEEFCLRLRRHGMVVVCSTRTLMDHPLGGSRRHRFLWRTVVTSHHAPFRRYYMIRNRVVTLKAFAMREPRWALQRLAMTATELAWVALLEEQPLAKLRAMLLGLWDGLRGRTGKAARTF